MAKPYAPDKDDPYPKPKPKPKGNGGGKGGGPGLTFDAFSPGQLSSLAEDLNTGFGGGLGAWKDQLRETSAPSRLPHFNFGGGGQHGGNSGHNGGGNSNGGGKDPNGVDPGNQNPTPGVNPNGVGHGRMMAPMPMQRGFLPAGQPMNQPPAAGIFAAQPQMQQAVRGPVQGPQMQLPPEILAMMRARQMGR